MIRLFLIVALGWAAIRLPAATIETVAGTGVPGFSGDGRRRPRPCFNQPFGVARRSPAATSGSATPTTTSSAVSQSRRASSTPSSDRRQTGAFGRRRAAAAATLNEPYEIRFHPNGDLYWVERLNHIVRRLDHATGRIHRVAGTGEPGFSGDGGPADGSRLARAAFHPVRSRRAPPVHLRHPQPPPPPRRPGHRNHRHLVRHRQARCHPGRRPGRKTDAA